MTQSDQSSRFRARLLRPAKSDSDALWAFVVLPKNASAKLPRRGRTTVDGTLNGQCFRATLEPDGQLSHWLRVNAELLESAGAHIGDVATFEITPAAQEPEPEMPPDLPWRQPPSRKLFGTTQPPSHAWTGFTGLLQPSSPRPAQSGSATHVSCLHPASEGFAVSIHLATTAKRSAHPQRQIRSVRAHVFMDAPNMSFKPTRLRSAA